MNVNIPDLATLRVDYTTNPKARFKKGTFPSTFLDAVLGEFQKIKLIRKNRLISAKQTLAEMSEYHKELLRFFYMVPASKYMEVGRNPRLGTLTPKAMFAQKLYHDVQYEEWDKSEEELKFFLGYGNDWLLEPEVAKAKEFVLDNLDAFRQQAIITKEGKELPLDGYKMSNVGTKEISGGAITNFWRMVLQLWICNSSKRVTDGSMILDPWDWDLVPEALDAGVTDIIQPKGVNDGLPF